MEPEAVNSNEREERLQEILVGYVDAREQGHPPDPKEFTARYPEFAGELEEYFAGLRQLDAAAAPLRELVQPSVARQLGDFRLLREVGRGGMGIVYEAEQISLDRRVALKVLPFASMLDSKQLQRFKNEAHAAAQLHHQNIVPVYAVGCERGVHYFAMQFIEGRTLDVLLRDLRRRAGLDTEETPARPSQSAAPLPDVKTVSRADDAATAAVDTTQARAFLSTEQSLGDAHYFRTVARLGIQAAEALEHAHDQGIIHRDIKPANLLVDNRGQLWITDFGLARCQADLGLTISGDLVGTLRYMSPEQALAKSGTVDQRSDIYSLGATLYELLTLQPVFAGQDRHELLRQIAFEEPRPPSRLRKSVPADLETVVLKAMAKEADGRYAGALELAEDLQRYLADRPVLAKRPTVVHRMRKWLARHKAMTAGVMGLLLLTTIGLAATTLLVWKKEEETRRALDDSRTSQRLAEEQKELAEKRERQARRYLYAADVNLAYQAMKGRQPARALRLLGLHRPGPAEEDLRGFEWYHLLDACGRGRTLTMRGHSGPVSALACSPDGKRLASGGEDGAAWIWDTVSGQGRVLLRAPGGKITSVAFTSDGLILAIGLEQGAILWDVAKDKEKARIVTHPSAVRPLAFSSDGTLLAIAGAGGVELWDAATRKPSVLLLTPHANVYSVAFSRDGRLLASGNNQGSIQLWKAPFSAQPEVLERHGSYVTGLSFSPDSRTLASAGIDGSMLLWDLSSKQSSPAGNRHTGAVSGVAFSPDGKRLVSAGEDGSLQLWQIGAGDCLVRGAPEEVDALSLSADGQTLATGQHDGTIGLWRVADLQADNDVLAHSQSINALALSRDSRTLVAVGGNLSREGKISKKGKIKLWDMTTSRELATWDASRTKLQAASLSPDGQTLACAGDEGVIQLWDITKRPPRLSATLPGHAGPVWCASFSPDGQLLATAGYGDNLVKLWKVATQQCCADLRGHTEPVWSVAFSPDGRTLASGSRDGHARIWDVSSQKCTNTLFDRVDRESWIWAVQFSPDGKILATTQGRKVALWDTRTWQPPTLLEGHSSLVRALVFFPDGKTLASGGNDRTVKLWDLDTGQERATLEGHKSEVSSLAVSADGRLLISGSWDGTVRLWRAPREIQNTATELDPKHFDALNMP